ncbi:MAG: endonuclease III [Candidatus Magasanikbacteria bacterium CG_4_9_14_0_2_um_filter_42_11]|uniref:Endonuclease III n=1 Tax=Candidatus Magasanikbacteria bacterium CG_4_9_14_0_2_um_filter_42_11 TaxID=1974643 RepID=A0A2M8FAD9_9BACT|nr:MAG: endonuclease III [Candidatus Magasanikbacteria bacterium CG10_big_fil_rev_8_21_14_0_10_43_9]PIY92028.1 MAG: endonuclease III [Candidatus Magasanikbacteria bacterium CG_4_10_14_0_8_um_filter_42_12]PJC52704.1 MAG: endonuclease III [Candidatus Magasanikbacteria bacterium CG_4_9_14_0_2_um_filter_42_11]
MLTLTERKQKGAMLLNALKTLVPKAAMMLEYSNNWELVVAVALSAQCTDKQVNKVTKTLFQKYATLQAYVDADITEFEQDIYSTGFYKNKAKNVLAGAKVVKEQFGGVIPHTLEELMLIPGVGRKTANVVLGNAYGIAEGIAVDTHVKRFARNFGLTTSSNPDIIERDLMAILPQEEWFAFTYYAIEYGRQYCPARCKHTDCPLREYLSTLS